ncbi:MAG: N-acetyl sugar amidotransferase [Bacteroidetes bacterium]|nr:N-acetyl sugar amidotransferase [Bacteroidota bacterium]
MKYCKKCLMPDTRPGIKFDEEGICMPCHNYEEQKDTDWDVRRKELESICEKYRGQNGNSYDCAIAVSGGKDSHYQVWYMKEIMKMNPLLISIGCGGDCTDTGLSNLQNIADVFSCDIITLNPNPNIARKMMIKSFKEIGQPTWYIDALIYAFPYRMAIKLGLQLLVYGENVNYTYGGKYNIETPSAKMQPLNDVVKPIWSKWIEGGDITEKELESAKQPSLEEYEKVGMEAIYLSYFTLWDSHRNYELAKRFGFRHLEHEYVREGTIEQYNQIDSIGYLLGQYLKYPKYGHASATEMASRWIRAGRVSREEMIPIVKEKDKKLDQGIVDSFLSFTGMKAREFYEILDKWYNPKLFERDEWGIWHEKFEVGIGL